MIGFYVQVHDKQPGHYRGGIVSEPAADFTGLKEETCLGEGEPFSYLSVWGF